MDDYLSKPVRHQELLAVLSRYNPKGVADRPEHRPEQNHAREITADQVMASEVLNKSELLSRVEGDEQLLRELIEVFLVDSGSLLQQVAEAVTRQDAADLERAAHKLKSTVSIFGNQAAMQTALVLEMMGRDRDLRNAREVLMQLKKQVEALEKALGRLRQETCSQS
jgi:HPt (histidine-containing phosphotransfer) domain-containing protein